MAPRSRCLCCGCHGGSGRGGSRWGGSRRGGSRRGGSRRGGSRRGGSRRGGSRRGGHGRRSRRPVGAAGSGAAGAPGPVTVAPMVLGAAIEPAALVLAAGSAAAIARFCRSGGERGGFGGGSYSCTCGISGGDHHGRSLGNARLGVSNAVCSDPTTRPSASDIDSVSARGTSEGGRLNIATTPRTCQGLRRLYAIDQNRNAKARHRLPRNHDRPIRRRANRIKSWRNRRLGYDGVTLALVWPAGALANAAGASAIAGVATVAGASVVACDAVVATPSVVAGVSTVVGAAAAKGAAVAAGASAVAGAATVADPRPSQGPQRPGARWQPMVLRQPKELPQPPLRQQSY